MSVELVVEELKDLDLAATPPCDVVIRNFTTGGKRPCPHPSVVRVRGTCDQCGTVKVQFLCSCCYDDAKKGELVCGACFVDKRPNAPITTLTEM